MTTTRRLGWWLMCAALSVLFGCAPLPAGPTGAPVPKAPPASGTQAPAPTRPRPEPQIKPRGETPPTGAPRDSTPSADAERVLATIPEPLSPSQQVPPPADVNARTPASAGAPAGANAPASPNAPAPAGANAAPGTPESAGTPGTITMRAPEAAFDTLRADREPAAEADGDSARVSVPVPSPTHPLGSTPGGTLTMPDTLAAPPVSPPPATAPTTPPVATAPPKAGGSGPCWRLQVAAPVEKAQGESRRDAAQSLLVVPMVVEFEKGLHKVRTRDCMSREAVDALKKRAIDSGFVGVFAVNTGATIAAPAKPKPKPKPIAKPTSTRKKRTR